MIQLIRGFKDILPDEIYTWQQIEKTATSLFKNFGFKEIRIPILERADLFARSIGDNTDIVEKEMYTFPDRKGDLISLRPEATASVVRSYIQHKLYAKDPVQKFYTIGPMFRRERPQKGRYRQFYQINAEVFGIDSPLIDTQLIFLVVTLFNKLKVSDINVHINSLGCPKCRPKFNDALSEFIAQKKVSFCPDCSRRSEKNPLRILDCKLPSCKTAVQDAPSIMNCLCSDCSNHFETVKHNLSNLGISFFVDQHLVRGLDYYTKTIFEIQTGSLGAQNAVAGGGRYDGLIKQLGGPDQPAVGFAIGLDRLSELVLQHNNCIANKPDIFIAALGQNSKVAAFKWNIEFGLAGIHVEIDLSSRSLKSQMKRANRLGAKHVLIVGDSELEEKKIILRNMETKKQVQIHIDCLTEKIKEYIK